MTITIPAAGPTMWGARMANSNRRRIVETRVPSAARPRGLTAVCYSGISHDHCAVEMFWSIPVRRGLVNLQHMSAGPVLRLLLVDCDRSRDNRASRHDDGSAGAHRAP